MGLVRPQVWESRSKNFEKIDAIVKQSVAEFINIISYLPKNTPVAGLIVPARFELRDGSNYWKKLRLSLVKTMREKGVVVIDPYQQLKKAGYTRTHFKNDGHWTPLAHSIAASKTIKWIESLPPKN